MGIVMLPALALTVVFHEMGHVAAALACKVPINEVGVGFGPALIRARFCGITMTLRLFPVGGCVNIDRDRFDMLSRRTKWMMLLAGPVGSLAGAWLCFTIAGLWVVSGSSVPEKGVNAVMFAFQLLWQIADLSVKAVAELLHKPPALIGPVGLVAAVGRAPMISFPAWIALTGALSAGMCLCNLIPLPPLDGGRALMSGLMKAGTSRWTRVAELAGIILLGLLAVVVTLSDVLIAFGL